MRKILGFVIVLLLVSGCSIFNSIEKGNGIKSKNITIQIVDNQKNEQHYSVQILTNGKETEKIAVYPQERTLITESKKQVNIKVTEGVIYTVRVFKTDVKSTQDLYNQPKTGEAFSQKIEPLAEVNFTPSNSTTKYKIRVVSD